MIGLAMMLATVPAPFVLNVGDQRMTAMTVKFAKKCAVQITVRASRADDVEADESIEPGSQTVVTVGAERVDRIQCILAKQADVLAKMADALTR